MGSHRCTENIGSFTRNPKRAISQNKDLDDIKVGIISSDGRNIIKLFDMKKIEQNTISIGNDAEMVYIIRYILACTRSG